MQQDAGLAQEPEEAREREAVQSAAAMTDQDRKAVVDNVVAALRLVFDPEIPVNVYDLGLIYRVELPGFGCVEIDMTLTAPGCPVAGEILRQVSEAAGSADGISEVKVKLVFEPPWDRSKISDEAKLELGLI